MILIVSLIILTFTLFTDANARRFGGGRSFGFTSHSSFHGFSGLNKSTVTPAYNIPNSNRAHWGSGVIGFLSGAVIASLLMGHGLGVGLSTWLLIGVLFIFIIRWKTKFRVYQPAGFRQVAQPPLANATVNFDTAGFLRMAKDQFIRLQAAYDIMNETEIDYYTSPVVFAEIQSQFKQRGHASNVTEVIKLDAQIHDISNQPNSSIDNEYQSTVVSVRFSGLMHEEINLPATFFTEIWHFREAWDSSRWVVTGIQQI